MLRIENREKLKQFLHESCSSAVLLDHVPEEIAKQIGPTCRLNALSQAMEVYRKFIPGLSTVRKSDPHSNQNVETLRKQAKRNYGSVVGELYNYTSLLELAISNKMDGSKVYQPLTEDEYIEKVIEIIDHQKCPALIFFDVTLNFCNTIHGYPEQRKGAHEHAATVLGYCQLNDKLHFIVSQWSKFYLYQADLIAQSALQIEKKTSGRVL